MSVQEQLQIAPEQLCWRCDPAQFTFASTEELESLDAPIGQQRALDALRFGLEIDSQGFNIFVVGESGTGRYSTLHAILGKRAAQEPVPDDWCYLNDFGNDNEPDCISLPHGKGRELHQDMEDLVRRLGEAIPRFFESREFNQQKNRLADDYQEKNRLLFQELEDAARSDGFSMQSNENGLVIMPIDEEGKPLSKEKYDLLTAEQRQEMDSKAGVLKERLNEAMRQAREMEKDLREKTRQVARDALTVAVGHLFAEQEEKYRGFPRVLEHLRNCRRDMLDRIDEFRPANSSYSQAPAPAEHEESPLERYRVNLLVDNSELTGAPVIFEKNPTYLNLFGRIEHVIHMGNASTNFRMIKAGSLHRANGGYLVIDCRELFSVPYVYEALKRCLRNHEIKIEDISEQLRTMAYVSLKPEAIPFSARIILVGSAQFYYTLLDMDPDFRKFFKVKADFDEETENTPENVLEYARYVATRCRREQLPHFTPDGVACVVEHAARLAENQKKLSCSFRELSDLIREAAFCAAGSGKKLVDAACVTQALAAGIQRANRIEEQHRELMREGTVLIDTDGARVGQINGLSVVDMGDHSFGKPSRLTASTWLGHGGIVNLEREVQLSGPIHDKGVMILSGFFGARYAQKKPLALAASICFEQSYGGVEGDSASSAELYALLSSLAEAPLQQGIAVTGSVNQNGHIQPIGGVNEKIEGFFRLCASRGLTGEQGVVIPVQNVRNLMLHDDVVAAARAGRFHIWAVSTIDEGIEILTGLPAGQRDENGNWPEGSINDRVYQKLREYSEAADGNEDSSHRHAGRGRGHRMKF
ncbi:MAG: AAA family ATPase [Deltaproteobacteria bacterium]|nr:AAA family ATPase [Deltaproteobacteria bacterium]